jgi:hypothetical protein
MAIKRTKTTRDFVWAMFPREGESDGVNGAWIIGETSCYTIFHLLRRFLRARSRGQAGQVMPTPITRGVRTRSLKNLAEALKKGLRTYLYDRCAKFDNTSHNQRRLGGNDTMGRLPSKLYKA